MSKVESCFAPERGASGIIPAVDVIAPHILDLNAQRWWRIFDEFYAPLRSVQ